MTNHVHLLITPMREQEIGEMMPALGATAAERRHAHRELFRDHLDNDALHGICEALNHELVLGRSYFF